LLFSLFFDHAPTSNILFICIFLFGISFPLKAHVDLDYPLGGESFIEGQSIHIEWHIVAFHESLNWDLLFSSNGGVDWVPIQMDITYDSLGYTWIVPPVFSSQCSIRVIQDNVGMDYWGTSTDFTILPDTSPPSLDAPAEDALIECDIATQEMTLQAWLDNHGYATVSNNCGELTWTNDYDGLSNGCSATGSALVIFTATDYCGSTFTVATFTIVDHQAPLFITLPMNMVVECNGIGNPVSFNQWLSIGGGAAVSEDCGNIFWTHDPPVMNVSCGESNTAVVTFYAHDECGNTSSPATASFIIVDTTDPTISTPAHDTIIECSSLDVQVIQQWLDHHGGAHASDVCGNVSWAHNYTALTPTCGAAGSANVTFTATDDCGNSSTTAATLTVRDSFAPVIHIPAQDTIIECGSPGMSTIIQSWLDRNAGAFASDQCGSVSWTNNYAIISDSCFADSISVTFNATDECGNSSTTQAFLITSDTSVIGETTVFAPLGATWYYSGPSNGPPWEAEPWYCYFLVEKDTFLLGRNARQIGFYINDGGTERIDSLTKYIAVTGDQVFYKVGDEFVLLYDFGAEPGDTIHSKVESSDLSLGCLSNFEEDIIDFSYVIDSVNTQLVDGKELRTQNVTSIDGPQVDDWGFIFEPVVERIGYYGSGGFWWGQGLGCILEAGYLRCYNDLEISWKNPAFDENLPCDYVATNEPKSFEYYQLLPNPTYGLVQLPDGAENISVYSMEGRNISFEKNESTLDLTGSPPGVYVVRFEINGTGYLGKVVVK
jgi:hypothetical protein